MCKMSLCESRHLFSKAPILQGIPEFHLYQEYHFYLVAHDSTKFPIKEN